ncbi:MAG: hypothetical protein ACD_48C00012G0001, partial [uncultured bacterium]
MFMKLTDFGVKRTVTQAAGFYIVYLILMVVVAGLTGGVVSLAAGKADDIEFGVTVGIVVAVLMCLGLGYEVLDKKRLTKQMPMLLLVLLSGVLPYVGGGLLGLVPIAYLTTRPKK